MGDDTKVITVTHQQMMDNFSDMHEVIEGLWSTAVEAQHKWSVQNACANKTKELSRINVGDFVLVTMVAPRSKLTMTWTGAHQSSFGITDGHTVRVVRGTRRLDS